VRVGRAAECQLNLAQAVTYLACAPKSNAATVGIGEARLDVREGRLLPVPVHLRDSHYGEPNVWVMARIINMPTIRSRALPRKIISAWIVNTIVPRIAVLNRSLQSGWKKIRLKLREGKKKKIGDRG